MSFAKIEYFSKTFAKKSKIPKILDKKSPVGTSVVVSVAELT